LLAGISVRIFARLAAWRLQSLALLGLLGWTLRMRLAPAAVARTLD